MSGLGPQRRAEALHQQVVPQRVHPTDPQQVVHQGPGAGAPGRHATPHLADQVAHPGHGQEVGRVAQLLDGGQLGLHFGARAQDKAQEAKRDEEPIPERAGTPAAAAPRGDAALALGTLRTGPNAALEEWLATRA